MEAHRTEAITLLSKYLPHSDSTRLEAAIHGYVQEYVRIKQVPGTYEDEIYWTKVNDIVYNLNPYNNHHLLPQVVSGAVPVEQLLFMSPHEMCPEKWKSIMERRAYIEYKKNNFETSDAYECKKCKQRKSYVYQLQTRSADEPMTTFVTCMNCGHMFKF